MPELPEVQTVVATLQPRLQGKTLLAATLHRPDMISPAGLDLPRRLRGRTVQTIARRGKRIVFSLDTGEQFFIHLGMTGRLTIEPSDTPVKKHTHLLVDVHTSPPCQLRFCDPRRFGEIHWLGRDRSGEESLGIEPLSMRASDLARRLHRTRRAIKTALLDQRLLAGLGNIYADEALFAARIAPHIPANTLTPAQIARLSQTIKQVLRHAIHHRGSTFRDYRDANGQAGSFQKLHRVYAREGQPCLICQTPIQRQVLGGRSTHFCPKCQK